MLLQTTPSFENILFLWLPGSLLSWCPWCFLKSVSSLSPPWFRSPFSPLPCQALVFVFFWAGFPPSVSAQYCLLFLQFILPFLSSCPSCFLIENSTWSFKSQLKASGGALFAPPPASRGSWVFPPSFSQNTVAIWHHVLAPALRVEDKEWYRLPHWFSRASPHEEAEPRPWSSQRVATAPTCLHRLSLWCSHGACRHSTAVYWMNTCDMLP